MANVPVQLKRIATQAAAAGSGIVLLDGQPIRVEENGRIYWGDGTSLLSALVTADKWTVQNDSSAFMAYRAELAKTHADGSTIASASTVNIGAAAGDQITISGTTTITAFDTITAGSLRRLTFSGALTLTHNATSLILPTAANITTAAGDAAIMQSLGAGNWRCIGYQRANGRPLLLTEVPLQWLRVATTLPNIPAAVTWLSGSSGNLRSSALQLSNYRQIRLMGYITTAGNSGSKVAIRYRSAYSATATDYSILGASSTEVAFVLTTGGGIYADSGWIDIVSAAQADVFLALVTKDGDGAADAVVDQVMMYMR